MMDQAQTPPAPKQPDPRASLLALKALVNKSAQENEAARAKAGTPPPPSAPPIDTSSIMGLLASLKDRLSYTVFGPSTGTTPNPAGTTASPPQK